MSSPSCNRCQQALAVESASGLCPGCAKEQETSQVSATSLLEQATPAPPGPRHDDATFSIAQASRSTPTLTGIPDAEIATGEPNADRSFRLELAGYDLLRYLGGGGMGDVYLAHEHSTERTVAIKFLRGAPHSTSADRFLTEVRALARLEHPNIVRVIEVDLERSDPYFTMEYAAGGTLADRIKKDGPLPPQEVARLLAVLARAVAAAHDASILHRDLKPSNIVFSSDGSPKITDFGLAKRTDLEEGLTVGSGPIGTPAYMPPEQLSSRNGAACPASDVYGLGATLYQVLTGRPPFLGEHAEIFAKVGSVDPDRIRSVRPEAPRELEAIVHKCLEKDPKNRYPTCAELADDLDRYLAGAVPKAPPLTHTRRLRQWAKRRRWRIAATAAAIGLAIASVLVGVYMAPIPKHNDPPQPPDPWEAVRSDWVNGKPAVLIGPTGGPKWHRWIIGAPEIGASATGDGSCAFELTGFGMLELCPEPPTDHYRIDAKIRYAKSKVTGNETPGMTSAGLYFGRATHTAARGEIVHSIFGVTFSDMPVVKQPGKPDSPKGVQLRMAAILQRAEHDAYGPTVGFRSMTFKRAEKLPGPWRPIEIEIAPGGVKVRWQNGRGEMEEFADVPAAELRSRYAQIPRRVLGALGNDHEVPPPEWSPAMPFGIWCNRASIDVKDVTVIPLP